MLLTLTLGRRWSPAPVVISLDLDNVEVDPDAIFEAANRVEDLGDDLLRLERPWQRNLRRLIERHSAPSMSVDDTAELCSDGGTYLGGWRCEPSGWTTIEASVV